MPHSWGIFIYDNGNFGVYELQNNQIEGSYLYFNCTEKGLCFYGSIKNKKLHGTNFAYTNKNSFLKV